MSRSVGMVVGLLALLAVLPAAAAPLGERALPQVQPREPAGAERAEQDGVAIREVVARYVDARERRDARALAALFTEDADQLVSSGEWRRGRDAVVRGGLESSSRSPGTRTIEVETVRFVTQEVAIADGRYEVGGAAGGAPRRMWTTFVMRRSAEGWRISAIRNMRPSE